MLSARQSFAGLQQFAVDKQDDGTNRFQRKDTVYYDNADEMQVEEIIARNHLETGDLTTAAATGGDSFKKPFRSVSFVDTTTTNAQLPFAPPNGDRISRRQFRKQSSGIAVPPHYSSDTEASPERK
ncbi:unnamed protein product [Sphagnum balticum]